VRLLRKPRQTSEEMGQWPRVREDSDLRWLAPLVARPPARKRRTRMEADLLKTAIRNIQTLHIADPEGLRHPFPRFTNYRHYLIRRPVMVYCGCSSEAGAGDFGLSAET
jgi:hypothetical protein